MDKKLKTYSMSIRVSEEELEVIKQASRIEAYSSYSEFVRRTALLKAESVIVEKQVDEKIMITIDNLKKVLEELHYSRKKKKDIYEKRNDSFDCIIKVNFANKSITYPEDQGMVIHRKTT